MSPDRKVSALHQSNTRIAGQVWVAAFTDFWKNAILCPNHHTHAGGVFGKGQLTAVNRPNQRVDDCDVFACT